MKRIRGVVAGSLLVASALASPAMAQSQTAHVARAGAATEGASEVRGGFLIPAIAVVAIILGIIALAGGGDDLPHSP